MSNAAAPRWLALMLMSMLMAMALAANLGAMPLSLRALWRAPLSDMVWQIWLHYLCDQQTGAAIAPCARQ